VPLRLIFLGDLLQITKNIFPNFNKASFLIKLVQPDLFPNLIPFQKEGAI